MDAEDFDYEINHLRSIHGPAAPYQLNLLGSHDTPRLLTLCEGDVDRAILAITFIFTYIGAPMIYYGDEIGFTGGDDPDCRRSMVWDETKWEPRLVQAYRTLIRARRDHSALRTGDFEKLRVFNGVYAYKRRHKRDEAVVILNPGERRQHVKIPLNVTDLGRRTWCDLITETIFIENEGYLQIEDLPSRSAYVLFPHKGVDIAKA